MSIKHYLLREKVVPQTRDEYGLYCGDSAPAISMVEKWFSEVTCGWTSSSDTEHFGRPLDSLHPRQLNNWWCGVDRTAIESKRVCESHRELIWRCGLDFELSPRCQKVTCKTGAASAYNWFLTESCDNSKKVSYFVEM